MVFRRTFHVILLLEMAGICCFAYSLPAAEPRQEAVGGASGIPQGTSERPVGAECQADREALAEIAVPIWEERRAGARIVRAYLAHLKYRGIRVTTRGREVDYLRGLVAKIRPLMNDSNRYPGIKVCLAESSQCNARSFPGGTLVFFRGFLQCAASEAAVVGIVGHELSHLDRGHHLWRLRRVKLARQTFRGNTKGPSAESLATAKTILSRIWTRPFQPEYEMEADRDAARWAYAAGYDPRELATMCLDPRAGRGGQPMGVSSHMPTHPDAKVRHQAITQQYDTLRQENPGKRLYVGKENLRRRVSRSQQEFSE